MIRKELDTWQVIEGADAEFCAAFNRGDAAGVAACYAQGGQLLPAHSEIVERPAISTFWQGVMNLGIKSVDLKPVEVERCGDYAHEVGAYVLRMADGKTADRGKYVVIWKLEQDAWKLYRDIWTTSLNAG